MTEPTKPGPSEGARRAAEERTHLAQQTYESILKRWEKYNNPKNLDWDWDKNHLGKNPPNPFVMALAAKLDTRWEDWRKQLLNAWAKDHRATMTALLEGGPAAPLEDEWVSVEAALPKIGAEVIIGNCWDDLGCDLVTIVRKNHIGAADCADYDDIKHREYTHWRAVPALPVPPRKETTNG